MLQFEPEIHSMVQKMCNKVLSAAETGQVINILDPYNCFTADAISQYCFGEQFGMPPARTPISCTAPYRKKAQALLQDF
jgi:hypothetical protein